MPPITKSTPEQRRAYVAAEAAHKSQIAALDAEIAELEAAAKARREARRTAVHLFEGIPTPKERDLLAKHPEWLDALRSGDANALAGMGGRGEFALTRQRHFYTSDLSLTERGHRLVDVVRLLDAENSAPTPIEEMAKCGHIEVDALDMGGPC